MSDDAMNKETSRTDAPDSKSNSSAASSDSAWTKSDAVASEEEKFDTLNSGTVGQEVGGFFAKIGRGIHWILPESLTLLALWLFANLGVYIGRSSLMFHIERIMAAAEPGVEVPHFLIILDFSLLFIQAILIVLPFIFLTIHHCITRGTEAYTNKSVLAPKPLVRYLLALAIALSHAIITYLLATVLYILNASFLGMGAEIDSFADFSTLFGEFATDIFMLPLFVPLLVACTITAVFGAWRIGVAKNRAEAELPVRPGRAAAACMIIFTLFFAVTVYPAAHIWQGQQQHQMEMEQEMFGDEEFMFGDEEFDLGDLDFEDLEGLDFGELDFEGFEDEEGIHLDELLGDEDFGEVTIE